jgi:predicted transcriptional regulator
MSCAKVIKKIRKTLLLEQEELAKHLGVSKNSVCRYEWGKTQPRMPVLRKLKAFAEKNGIKVKIEDLTAGV